MPPVGSVLGNCVVGRGNKGQPVGACARGTGCDGLAATLYLRHIM